MPKEHEDDTLDLEIKETPVIEEKLDDKPSQEEEDGVKSQNESKIYDSREEIYANFEKRRNEEVNPESEDADEKLPAEDEEVDKKEESQEVDDDPKSKEQDIESQDDPMVKLKIYGKEVLKPKSEVDAHGGKAEYQKQLAAAEKAEIERERREIEAEKERLAEERKALEASREVPSQDEPLDKKTDLPSDDRLDETEIRQKIAEASESLFDGDTDKFTDTIMNVISSKEDAGKTVDVDKIVENVIQQTRETMTREQQFQELKQAQTTFKSEYPELVADDELFKEVDDRTVFLQQRHPDKAPLEILRLAGDEVSKRS